MRPILTLRHYSHDLIVHSHDHAQLVFGLSGALDFEVGGQGSQVMQQSFVVIPQGAHHACGSPKGSRCLVLDVPSEQWLAHSLGEHAEASRRLLDTPGRLPLDAGQSQLVSWLASSPVQDPLIAQQGAVLLLASLNSAVIAVMRDVVQRNMNRHGVPPASLGINESAQDLCHPGKSAAFGVGCARQAKHSTKNAPASGRRAESCTKRGRALRRRSD